MTVPDPRVLERARARIAAQWSHHPDEPGRLCAHCALLDEAPRWPEAEMRYLADAGLRLFRQELPASVVHLRPGPGTIVVLLSCYLDHDQVLAMYDQAIKEAIAADPFGYLAVAIFEALRRDVRNAWQRLRRVVKEALG